MHLPPLAVTMALSVVVAFAFSLIARAL
jgi:hypothetical protein